ncbi:VrrA/YqfQ family protein [Bacillus sp. 2205SS5-2]|uniref:VrrA/YqfQ family protein n=1 Tax=Bacillus sp. 2205SS5-2 TaxID=3109031 RepID=UPI00300470FD
MPPRNPSPFQFNPRGGRPPSLRGGFSPARQPQAMFGRNILQNPQNSIIQQGARAAKTNSGLLSRLFQRGSTSSGVSNAVSGFERSAAGNVTGSGGLLKGLLQPGNVNSMLSNTQQMLQTAQQVGPMIKQFQQYGPIIKNLPAMWKLYRGLQDGDSEEAEEDTTESSDANESTETASRTTSKRSKKTTSKKKSTTTLPQEEETKLSRGNSKPKLYI